MKSHQRMCQYLWNATDEKYGDVGHRCQNAYSTGWWKRLSNYRENCSILLGTGEAILENEKISRLIEWSNMTGNSIRLLTTGVPLVPRNIDILAQAQEPVADYAWWLCKEDIGGVQRINLPKVKGKISLAAKRIKIVLNYTLTNKNHQSLCDVVVFANQNNIGWFTLLPWWRMSYVTRRNNLFQ